jgi:hypothetical protein
MGADQMLNGWHFKRFIMIGLGTAMLCSCSRDNLMPSWTGQPLEKLVWVWGRPSQDQQLSDGTRVVSYLHGHPGIASPYWCKLLVSADHKGKIIQIDENGTIGGCNQLLIGKPERNSLP